MPPLGGQILQLFFLLSSLHLHTTARTYSIIGGILAIIYNTDLYIYRFPITGRYAFRCFGLYGLEFFNGWRTIFVSVSAAQKVIGFYRASPYVRMPTNENLVHAVCFARPRTFFFRMILCLARSENTTKKGKRHNTSLKGVEVDNKLSGVEFLYETNTAYFYFCSLVFIIVNTLS